MAVPEKSRGYIQVFLDGGLNQQKMGVSDQEYAVKMHLGENGKENLYSKCSLL